MKKRFIKVIDIMFYKPILKIGQNSATLLHFSKLLISAILAFEIIVDLCECNHSYTVIRHICTLVYQHFCMSVLT